jgi:HSP20 family protein
MFGRRGFFDDDLFDEVWRMQQQMDQMFGTSPWPRNIRSVARGTYPPINVASNPDKVDVYVFAAGIDPKSLDISIQQNLLTVAGERAVITEEGGKYYRSERFSGEFRRVVTLPDDVDPDRVDANYRDGVLHVALQRHESAKPRQIQVK